MKKNMGTSLVHIAQLIMTLWTIPSLTPKRPPRYCQLQYEATKVVVDAWE